MLKSWIFPSSFSVFYKFLTKKKRPGFYIVCCNHSKSFLKWCPIYTNLWADKPQDIYTTWFWKLREFPLSVSQHFDKYFMFVRFTRRLSPWYPEVMVSHVGQISWPISSWSLCVLGGVVGMGWNGGGAAKNMGSRPGVLLWPRWPSFPDSDLSFM